MPSPKHHLTINTMISLKVLVSSVFPIFGRGDH
jgi:hypothetical protein